MGVTGLWKLVEQSGKPVPLETLENKVLAVGKFFNEILVLCVADLWIHQTSYFSRYIDMVASGDQRISRFERKLIVECAHSGTFSSVVQIDVLSDQACIRF